jgi:hypothetical protein
MNKINLRILFNHTKHDFCFSLFKED